MSTLPQNSFIVTEKSKPKRTIERKIASLIFLESHDVEGTLFVESLVCLGGREKADFRFWMVDNSWTIHRKHALCSVAVSAYSAFECLQQLMIAAHRPWVGLLCYE